jgi:hypothetical protein
MVERDKRTDPGGTLPFKLALPQRATTFVKFAAELGRDANSAVVLHSRATGANAIVRRIKTNPAHSVSSTSTEQSLGDLEIDLVVRTINHNQAASALCLGCQKPGPKLQIAIDSSTTSSPKVSPRQYATQSADRRLPPTVPQPFKCPCPRWWSPRHCSQPPTRYVNARDRHLVSRYHLCSDCIPCFFHICDFTGGFPPERSSHHR